MACGCSAQFLELHLEFLRLPPWCQEWIMVDGLREVKKAFTGFNIRTQFRSIDRWLEAFEEIPYYMATKSDYYTHCMDIPPQYGTPFPSDDDIAKQTRAFISPKQAVLPVKFRIDPEPLTQEQMKSPLRDHLAEAAWSLIRNHERITKFCCRAAGDDVGNWAFGNPTRCEQSDPFARPSQKMLAPVDALLRSIAEVLLEAEGVEGLQRKVLAAAEASGLPRDNWLLAGACLAYLRDRVGVPRDMSVLRTGAGN
ncbi:unnamed protein product [Polarella glacialis]|uniref:Uncharacterized protein n=1 Tax=Polarella glacialis TaxID=89957 RepID=A0A813JJY3_POLGL|nr:unnamed protein product [Polarella glacialis]